MGEWIVTFTNGIEQTVDIAADGKVTVTEPKRTAKGKAVVKDGVTEIRYDDDRVELWSFGSAKDNLTVQHWHPISARSKTMPAIGSALKNDTKPSALKVHEWGTFTVLQGSSGQVIDWYQAPNKLVDLPPFVKQQRIRLSGKSGTTQTGGMDTVRMETPVLYFYPEKEMDVTVTAKFLNGRITEIFPPAVNRNFSGPTMWHGSLLPPNSPEKAKIPKADGPKGRHYAAAREVPEAWLFRNTPLPIGNEEEKEEIARIKAGMLQVLPLAEKASEQKAEPVDPIDHFIFYRGAGRPNFSQISARQGNGPGNFTLYNYGKSAVPKLFALQISDGQTSWVSLDQLEIVKYDKTKRLNHRSITFPKPSGATHQVADDLRAAMIESLHSEGLTKDEATAMVNTWDNLWFTEPGTRILAILPQQTADEMVPLQISPVPTEIDRVFVARVEILTREVEQELTSLLSPPSSEAEAAEMQTDAQRLEDIQLGRYSAGGMERAADLIERKVRNRFARLQHTAAETKKLQANRD